MAILMQRPDVARARPSTLLADDSAYKSLYNNGQSLDTFYSAAFIGKKVDAVLRTSGQFSATNKSDILFYVIYVLASRLSGRLEIANADLLAINLDEITEPMILDCAKWVSEIYNELGGNDKIAKGPLLIEEIKKNWVHLKSERAHLFYYQLEK